MKHIIGFLLKFVVCVFVIYGGFCGVAFACENNEIDVLGDGIQCELAKFSITTTELTADTEFRFYMSASGNFYVDWGDGTVDTITRTNTTETLYSHTFTTSGTKTIRFGGLATGYSTSSTIATIRFGNTSSSTDATPGLIAAISGSIGQIFPTLNHASNRAQYHPIFRYGFAGTLINSIPPELFDGVTTLYSNMFDRTFAYCHYLTSIPENLFWGIIYGIGANSAFSGTFQYNSSLTEIPANLFKTINVHDDNMFAHTFGFCSGLTSIPENLFNNVTIARSNMFTRTFWNCTKLISIPDNLFSNITDYRNRSVFLGTFQNCTNLTGYIPPSMFSGMLRNNLPFLSQLNYSPFQNTALATSCPPGTVQFVTGYEEYWDGHVSCVDENLVCNSGEYFPAHWYQCEQCPENNYCVGGTYPYSETVSAGATQCPNNWYSPAGSSSVDQCGRILHVGDGMVYLRSVKQTTPSLNVQIDDDIFYGNMTTADVSMNINTERKLKINYDGQTYSVYDDTVTVPE